MNGCEWCFHLAANYRLWLPDYAPIYHVNVDGTRNVLEAAGQAGCQKIIHCSTVGCIGLPKEVSGKIIPSKELDVATDDQLTCDYKRSTFQAESLAVEAFRINGLPVVIVNPSAPVGPGDGKPTPTGQFIVDFLNRRLPAYLDTGLNWVHVRDVAVGHILAAEKGQIGSRYILGNQQGNWTMQQTFVALEKISGLTASKRKLPYWLALCIAEVSEGVACFTGQAPRATLAGVRLARHKMWFDSGRRFFPTTSALPLPMRGHSRKSNVSRHNSRCRTLTCKKR